MKEKLVILLPGIFFIAGFNLFGQGKYPVAKAYAYQQLSYGGVNRKLPGKDGHSSQSKNKSTTYFLYLEAYSGKDITLDALWIEDRAYEFEASKSTTPVIKNYSAKSGKSTDGITDTLVSATVNDVWNIKPKKIKPGTSTSKYINQLLLNNKVLFVYKYDGKKYYLAVQSIKQLPPEFLK